MNRMMAFRFGVIAYFTFFAAVAHAIFFVENMVVPKTIDGGGPITPVSQAIVINLLLMTILALQHSVMARKGFKQWWTGLVPTSVERTAHLFIASLVVLVLMWQWRPMPEMVWQVTASPIAMALITLSFLGWAMVFTSNFVINNWELFGLQHIGDYFHDSITPEPTPLYHQLPRYLIYLGFIIAFWSTPTMTTGHLLFASVMSIYLVIGAMLRETDLIDQFAEHYRRYRERVAMRAPSRRSI